MPIYTVTILGTKELTCELDVQVEASNEEAALGLAWEKLNSGNCSQHPNRESGADDADVEWEEAISVRLLRP